jgi:blocked-early-in-transport protein 1
MSSSKFDVDHRAALFGKQFAKKERDPELGMGDSHLERENDAQIRDLSDKVDTLKSISLSIQGAVRESSSILSGMGEQFDSATRLVKGSLGRVSLMVQRRTGHHLWHFVVFVLVAFVLIWVLFRR